MTIRQRSRNVAVPFLRTEQLSQSETNSGNFSYIPSYATLTIKRIRNIQLFSKV